MKDKSEKINELNTNKVSKYRFPNPYKTNGEAWGEEGKKRILDLVKKKFEYFRNNNNKEKLENINELNIDKVSKYNFTKYYNSSGEEWGEEGLRDLKQQALKAMIKFKKN